jgi:5-formyltetrahydrofolate cyclo-ligase
VSIGTEVNPCPLFANLRTQGYTLALPVMNGRDQPLLFRAWQPGDPLEAKVWGIREPSDSAPLVTPDIVLTALLAFDDRGWRLGWGGGYFDRSIRALRGSGKRPVTVVGLAYDEQKVDAVPHLDYDEPLDWILTPSGPLRCRHRSP